MKPPSRRDVLAFLKANPDLEVIAHPNPAGLGPRRFVGLTGGEYVFDRPGRGTSYLTPSHVTELTADGFTAVSGRIVYRKVKDVVPPGPPA